MSRSASKAHTKTSTPVPEKAIKKKKSKSTLAIESDSSRAAAASAAAVALVSKTVIDYEDDKDEEDESIEEIGSVIRPVEELVPILKAGNVKECTNAEVLSLVLNNQLPLPCHTNIMIMIVSLVPVVKMLLVSCHYQLVLPVL
ncbi:unnamed protein product [Ambrosiozyma monospora]|uniref:Unnamed protein product n=1 Tax=Ambrosiozyma monospora TaxID=43982 RepID=A0ACB5U439_AMBMO|nr:unnamed protein product [Ambrosiozyma monospora]